MLPLVARTAILLLVQQQPAAEPRAVVRQAMLAVQGDSAAAVAERWTARLARDSADPAARLGLAALAQLTYRYGEADSLYAELAIHARPGAERWALRGKITRAQGFVVVGRLVQADSLLAGAAEEARALGERAAEAEALIQLARLRARTAGPAASQQLLARAAPLIAADDLELTGQHRCAEAHVRGFQGDAAAIELAQAGQALANRAGDLRLEAGCLATVGEFQSFRGEVSRALATFAAAIELLQRARDRGALAAAHHWRGFLLRTVARLGEARQEAVRAIREGEASGNRVAQAWSLLTLAQISAVLGDGASGSDYIRRSIQLHEANGDELGLATALVVKGDLAMEQGRWAEAERAYRRGVAWAEAFGDPHRLAWSYSKAASLARNRGDWERAGEALDSSRSVALRNGMSGWVRILRYDFGALSLVRGRLAEAESTLEIHLSDLSPNENITRYITRARLAELHARRGAIERAETEFSAAADEFDRWRATLSEAELRVLAFQYAADQADPDLGVASIISALADGGRADSAFRFAERRRARELLDRIVRARAIQVRDLEDYSESDDAIGRRAPPALAAPLTLKQVETAIPGERTAILEYVTGRGGEPTTLFVIARGHTATHRLAPIDSLAPLADRFAALVRSGSVPAVLGRRLGQALLGPAIADLADGVTHLLVVPDDVLHRVPFDALQTADGRWAVERFALSQVPSASVAVHLWEKQRNADEVALLAVADPAFGQSGTAGESHDTDLLERAFQEAGGLPRLAASAREARSVARFARRAVLRLREGASESFLKRAQLDRYQVLHFATHALADERALTRTALALSPGEGEDGFVTAADLAELRLDADLVVLSGCNTAGGVVVGGEGIAGLTAPLLEAGARAVVASRWPIGDRTTARLLEEFYRLQAEGLSVGDALRSVKLRALQRGEPSAVWATFSVVGDPFVQLSLQKPRARLNWAVLVGLSLVVAYLVWMRRRRGLARTGPASRRSAATHQR